MKGDHREQGLFAWHAVESDRLPDLPPDEPRRWSRRTWLFVAGALLLVAIVAAVVLRWQVAERQQAMRADLEAFVRSEEQARLFGLRERASEIVAPDVPETWLAGCLDSFPAAGEAEPITLEVEEVVFDGQGALAILRLDGVPQARYYRLANGRWRRVPLPLASWGEEATIAVLPNGVELVARERDRAFAQELARDLPALFGELARWPNPPEVEAIVVAPEEFAGPKIEAEGRRVVVNSPLLVTPQEGVGGRVLVWLELAGSLFGRAGPEWRRRDGLPWSERFLKAATTVASARWAFAPAEYARFLGRVRGRLEGGWVSPFLAAAIEVKSRATEPAESDQANAAALLVADLIYKQAGAERLAAMVGELGAARTWDDLFERTLGRRTLALEAEAAAQAGLPGGPALDAEAPGFPLEATWLDSAGPRLDARIGGSRQPVRVELSPETAIETSNRESVAAECLTPGSSIRIEGEWLEAGYRLSAARIVVEKIQSPLVARARAPADTLAYLFADPIGNRPNASPALVALGRDGTITRLVDLPRYAIGPLLVQGTSPPRFVFVSPATACNRAAITLYDPVAGEFTTWLAPLGPSLGWTLPVWRADREELLLFYSVPPSGVTRYTLVEPGGSPVVETLGELDPPFLFYGWSAKAERAIVLLDIQGENPQVGLVDLQSQEATWLEPAERPSSLIGMGESANGAWFAYFTGEQRGGFTALHLLDLTTGAEVVPLRAAEDEALFHVFSSPTHAGDRLLVIAVAQDDDGFRITRLWLVDPDRPEATAAIEEGIDQIFVPVACDGGSVLYVAEQGGSYAVRVQRPGDEPRTLAEADYMLLPLVCPGTPFDHP